MTDNAGGPVAGGLVRRWVSRLRYPKVLLLTALLFGADLLIPDVIPFIDEILLGSMTALMAMLRQRHVQPPDEEQPEPVPEDAGDPDPT